MRAASLETAAMTKRFGALTVLDHVDMKVPAGSFHALLGENGAGKSTLVKCIMGSYRSEEGGLLVDGQETLIPGPDAALSLGLGMVYQQFTLVPSMTVAENMVLARVPVPRVIDWKKERAALEAFLARMPFRVPLDRRVSTLSAGEKQKVEILKLLNLGCRFLILDEPTAVLTSGEADEVLGFLRGMVDDGDVTVLMITHKFREVTQYADAVTILHRGKLSGAGAVKDLGIDAMARMMLGGEEADGPRAVRKTREPGETYLEVRGISALRDDAIPALKDLSLAVRAGAILGIAGVSGNGQSELVQVLAGQRRATISEIRVHGAPFGSTRAEIEKHGLRLLTEDPLRNAGVGSMSVASNMALRAFDRAPLVAGGIWVKPGAIRAMAASLIKDFGVRPIPCAAPAGTPTCTSTADVTSPKTWRRPRCRFAIRSRPGCALATASRRPSTSTTSGRCTKEVFTWRRRCSRTLGRRSPRTAAPSSITSSHGGRSRGLSRAPAKP